MFCDLIIKGIPEISNFFNKLNINFYFTKPQIKHLIAFVIAMMLSGYNGKMKDISELSLNTHRTNEGRFLDSDSWNEGYLLNIMQVYVIRMIKEKSRKTGLPIYVIIDDTICEKTRPSSKAEDPINGCDFHFSHLEGKSVYGQQFVGAMLRCGDLVLPYNVVLYEKEKESKIEIAKEIIESLPKVSKGYILTDSWYTSVKLFKTAQKKGYEYIGGFKRNRIIYPKKYKKNGISVERFAKTLNRSDFDIVTVKGKEYYIYTYLGKINDYKGVVKVVISYPKGALLVPKAMKSFISTDIKMSGRQLLMHYSNRWPIEVYFRESNRRLGMKECQVRSLKAIKRYQYIVMLSYIFCGMEVEGSTVNFSKQRKKYEKQIKRYQVTWIYEQTIKKVSLEDLFKELKIA